MTDLVRRALLGDRTAQKECTEQGVILPCPYCGGTANFTPDYFLPIFDIVCECGVKIGPWQGDEHNLALAAWNTRQAPPIGRCGDCAYSQNIKPNRKGFNICPASGMEITNADFCSYFEPKVHKKEANHETD